MRRRRASKREILPDPKFGSVMVSRFINILMWDGKKSLAQRIFYRALDTVAQRIKNEDPLEVFKGNNLIALAILGAFKVFDEDLIRIIENEEVEDETKNRERNRKKEFRKR